MHRGILVVYFRNKQNRLGKEQNSNFYFVGPFILFLWAQHFGFIYFRSFFFHLHDSYKPFSFEITYLYRKNTMFCPDIFTHSSVTNHFSPVEKESNEPSLILLFHITSSLRFKSLLLRGLSILKNQTRRRYVQVVIINEGVEDIKLYNIGVVDG